jgi:hypothetical protein
VVEVDSDVVVVVTGGNWTNSPLTVGRIREAVMTECVGVMAFFWPSHIW